jgi:hypothetical protein
MPERIPIAHDGPGSAADPGPSITGRTNSPRPGEARLSARTETYARAMTTFAPRRQSPVAAGHGAPLRLPFTSTAPAPSPIAAPVVTPVRGRLAALVAGLRRRPASVSAHDAVYRNDDGGSGDDGGWD